MKMTDGQRVEFESLSLEQKKLFSVIMEEHPDWQYSQIVTKMAFEDKINKTVERIGDIDPNDPEIWITILEGVKLTLHKVKSIGVEVFGALDNVICEIKTAVKKGIKEISHFVGNLLGSLFNKS